MIKLTPEHVVVVNVDTLGDEGGRDAREVMPRCVSVTTSKG